MSVFLPLLHQNNFQIILSVKWIELAGLPSQVQCGMGGYLLIYYPYNIGHYYKVIAFHYIGFRIKVGRHCLLARRMDQGVDSPYSLLFPIIINMITSLLPTLQ